MTTTSHSIASSRNLAIDNMRGLAAVAVVVYHYMLLLSVPGERFVSTWGMFGVDLFFIISGYLITRSTESAFERHGVKRGLASYAIGRVCRILPAYYVSLFAMVLLAAVTADASWIVSRGFAWNVAKHLVFASYLVDKDCGFGFNGAYWTLSVEALWYLLVIPLALLRISVKSTLLLIVASLAYLVALDAGLLDALVGVPRTHGSYLILKHYWAHQLPGQFFYFGIGILWARLTRGRELDLTPRRGKLAAQGALFVVLGALAFFIGSAGNRFITGIYLEMAVATTACFAVFFFFGGLSSRVVGWFGKVSYSLYLWHFPLIIVARHLHVLEHTTLARATVVYAVLLLGISSLSYYFVEEMGFVVRDRLLARVRPANLVPGRTAETTLPLRRPA